MCTRVWWLARSSASIQRSVETPKEAKELGVEIVGGGQIIAMVDHLPDGVAWSQVPPTSASATAGGCARWVLRVTPMLSCHRRAAFPSLWRQGTDERSRSNSKNE